jgi:hypothetical protein
MSLLYIYSTTLTVTAAEREELSPAMEKVVIVGVGEVCEIDIFQRERE